MELKILGFEHKFKVNLCGKVPKTSLWTESNICKLFSSIINNSVTLYYYFMILDTLRVCDKKNH